MITVTLTGSAVTGINAPFGIMEPLPLEVCLGRIKPDVLPIVPQLSNHFRLDRMATPPPASINRRDKAAAALARMYCNDQLGCCVISGKAHALAIWSANDPDSGGLVQATDSEIKSQYSGICGPGDRGCNIGSVLDVMVKKGFQAGGKFYKLDGYCAVDWTNKLLVEVVQCIGGATTIGIDLPQAWTNSAIWDVTNTQIVGGHDVTPIDYDTNGVYISSWGRVYLITWRAFLSKTWLSEYYFLLSPLWYGPDRMSPFGIDADGLKADLAMLKQGEIPEIGPVPPPIKPGVIGPVEECFSELLPQLVPGSPWDRYARFTHDYEIAWLTRHGYK